MAVYRLVHEGRRGLTRWAGATKCTLECYAELLPGPGEFGVELVSIAGVCECTCVHYADARKRLCTHWGGRTWVWMQN